MCRFCEGHGHMRNLPVGITLGDPAGIGPEIVARVLGEGPPCPCVVYGDAAALGRAARLVGASFDVRGRRQARRRVVAVRCGSCRAGRQRPGGSRDGSRFCGSRGRGLWVHHTSHRRRPRGPIVCHRHCADQQGCLAGRRRPLPRPHGDPRGPKRHGGLRHDAGQRRTPRAAGHDTPVAYGGHQGRDAGQRVARHPARPRGDARLRARNAAHRGRGAQSPCRRERPVRTGGPRHHRTRDRGGARPKASTPRDPGLATPSSCGRVEASSMSWWRSITTRASSR